MAGAAIFAGRILLVLILLALILLVLILLVLILLVWVAGRLICGKLVMMRSGGMVVAAHRLHGDRSGKHIAAEERQPDGQYHCNKFSGGAEHGHSLAKAGGSVK